MQEGVYFGQGIQWNSYCDQTDSFQYIVVNLIIFIPINIYILFGTNYWSIKNRCHFCFKAICRPKTNHWGKCFILLFTVLFIEEEWLSPLTLLKTSLLRQFCSENLLHIGRKNTFQLNKFVGESGRDLEKQCTFIYWAF